MQIIAYVAAGAALLLFALLLYRFMANDGATPIDHDDGEGDDSIRYVADKAQPDHHHGNGAF